MIRDVKTGAKQAAWTAAGVFLAFLAGCSHAENSMEKPQDDGTLKIVTTVFPYYDFTRQIAGSLLDSGEAELTLIVPAGMDSHSFEPTPADIIELQSADIIICNGGAMEHWFQKVSDSLNLDSQRVITMMDYVDTVEEEIVEGMEAEAHDHSEDHVHEAGEELEERGLYDDGHEEEIEYDEHIWTSPVNAMKLSQVIADTLCQADPSHESMYMENLSSYESRLSELDQTFREIVEQADGRLAVFGDKFPLRYFFDEYGLEYRAAFTGCSTDTEPSAKTIAYLIDKVREFQIPAVYYLELSSHRVAEIIGEETGAKPLLFHSCHNVTRREFDSGVTYLELMEQNAVNLRKGLDKWEYY